MSLKRPLYESIIDVDEFKAAYDADDPVQALERAERAVSTTEREYMPLCPVCYNSVSLIPKPGHRNIPNKIDTRYRCGHSQCGAHFNEPAKSIAELREEAREELSTAARHAARLARVVGVDR